MICLISPDERKTVLIDGAEFDLRRPGAADTPEISRLAAEYPPHDAYAHTKAITKTCLVGWFGVGDAGGNEIPFSPELVDALPLGTLQRLNREIDQLSKETAEKKEPGPSTSGES